MIDSTVVKEHAVMLKVRAGNHGRGRWACRTGAAALAQEIGERYDGGPNSGTPGPPLGLPSDR